jgi:ABC-type polysaccharide/polyol phosphate transport system ATPase subunit
MLAEVVQVQNISKLYRLYRRPSDRMREFLRLDSCLHTDFWALRDVNLEVGEGETLGIIGPNGGGKSTLLQIVGGILEPTRGRVVTRGRIAALLELGAGFNPEFTGRENVLLNGEILGLSRAGIERAMPSIEEFAGIGEFIDRPVKEYSSGMYVRLAFAAAIHVEPDILIVDEALAVGDAVFANRCIRKFEELRRRRVTVLLVSHDLGLVKQLSDRAVLLVEGRIAACGAPNDVVNRYIGLVLERQQAPERGGAIAASFRHGDGASEVAGVTLLDASGHPVSAVTSGDQITIRIHVRGRRDCPAWMAGILIRTRIGAEVYGTNTVLENTVLPPLRAGAMAVIEFRFECWLTPQQYTLTVATQNQDGSSQDWLDDALVFDVAGRRRAAGVADLRAEVRWRELP